MKTTNILTIPIYTSAKSKLLNELKQFLNQNNPKIIATVNAEFMVEANRNKEFKQILLNSNINLADGNSVRGFAWFLNKKFPVNKFIRFFSLIFRLKSMYFRIIFLKPSLNIINATITGSDLIWDILKLAQDEKKSVYFLGAKSEVLNTAIAKIKVKYPNLIIAGLSSEKFEVEELPKKVAQTKPDILLVAFGAPKQELFLYRNRNVIKYKIGIGLGGTFDFIAGTKTRAPKFFQKIGLEWLWRLAIEPTRFKRIYNAVIIFPYLIIKSKMKG